MKISALLTFLCLSFQVHAQLHFGHASSAGAHSNILFNARPPYANTQWNAGNIVAWYSGNGFQDARLALDIIDADGSGWDRTVTIAPTAGSVPGGYLGIGTTNPKGRLHVINDEWYPSIVESAHYNQLNIRHSGNTSWGLILTNSSGYDNAGYHNSTSGENNSAAIVNFHNDALHFGTNNQKRMTIDHVGRVGIGVLSPEAKLTVDGAIRSEEVKVEVVNAPDYVFAEDYDLRTLQETNAYIQENQHLPEVPSAKAMEANGVELGEMNMLLLKKIEELTLHLIDQNSRLEKLESENKQLQAILKGQ